MTTDEDKLTEALERLAKRFCWDIVDCYRFGYPLGRAVSLAIDHRCQLCHLVDPDWVGLSCFAACVQAEMANREWYCDHCHWCPGEAEFTANKNGAVARRKYNPTDLLSEAQAIIFAADEALGGRA